MRVAALQCRTRLLCTKPACTTLDSTLAQCIPSAPESLGCFSESQGCSNGSQDQFGGLRDFRGVPVGQRKFQEGVSGSLARIHGVSGLFSLFFWGFWASGGLRDIPGILGAPREIKGEGVSEVSKAFQWVCGGLRGASECLRGFSGRPRGFQGGSSS